MTHALLDALWMVARIAAWLAILAVIFVPLEQAFAAHPKRVFRRQLGVDLAYYAMSSVLPAILLSVPVALLAWAVKLTVPGWLTTTTASLPLWAQVVLGLLANDFGYYWGHRWSHQNPFLWKFHAIHHSAEEVDFLVNTRAHPFDLVFGRFCALTPIYVLGLGGPSGVEGSVVPALASVIGTIWGFFIHANLRWRFGPLEWLVSTPAFHHWHHTSVAPLDRNFAATFPWLDRLFGTHHQPTDGSWPESYGLANGTMPETLADQLAYPLARPKVAATPTDPVAPKGPGGVAEVA